MYETHRESDRHINRRILSGSIVCPRESNTGSAYEPILVSARTNIDCCRKSYPLFRALRHLAPSPPICLSKVTDQALRLIASIPLIQRKEKCPSYEEKSAFP